MTYTPPPSSSPPGSYPPGSYPPGSYSPGSGPPGSYPPAGSVPPPGGAPPPGGWGQPPPPPPSKGGSTTTIIVVVALVLVFVCLPMVACCGFLGLAGLIEYRKQASWNDMYDYGWYDSGTGTATDWSWGQLKPLGSTVDIYSTNSTSSTVLETKSTGDVFDYYGYDDTYTYYRVKTSAGTDGYVLTTQVDFHYEDTFADTADWKWGELKISASSSSVYSTNSSSSTVLETLSRGDRIDYYGFDDSFNYYRVKTASGSDGYLKLLDAEIAY